MMNYLYKIMALALVFLITACQEDDLIKQTDKPVQKGDEIIFSANSGYEMDARSSRTVYSGDSYTEGGKTYERIEWITNDKIGIFCKNAQNKTYADYEVINAVNSTDKNHSAYLQRHESSNGLHWGSPEQPHDFIAIYPSPTMPDADGSKTSLEGNVYLEDNILHGWVPMTQTPISVEQNKNFNHNGSTVRTATFWAKPDMRYSYMVASTTGVYPEVGAVELNFQPISTALEIEIKTDRALSIANIRLQTKSGKAITGRFECPIKNDGTPDSENIIIKDDETKSNTLNIPLGSGGQKLSAGNVLRVTALLLPTGVDESDLEITISGDSDFGGFQKGTLRGVELEAHKKHYITNLNLQAKVEGNNWISGLENDVLLRGLSIPGAANAFSYAYDGSNTGYYRTQAILSGSNNNTIDHFDALWNMGVRCFELVSDRPASGNTSLGGQSLRCNNQTFTIGNKTYTIDDAISAILGKLANNEQEFAMVILTYQPTGADDDPDRSGYDYMNSLIKYYETKFANEPAIGSTNEHEGQLILYSPNLTVGEARGKLMIVARPTSEGEDTNIDGSVAGGYKILTVKGWGTLVDKWYKRGYDAKLYVGEDYKNGRFVEVKDNISSHAELDEMEDWIFGPFTNSNRRPTNISSGYSYFDYNNKSSSSTRPQKGSQRFEYDSDQGFTVWAQEWRRVSNTTQTGTNYWGWFESYEEKQNDVIDTYQRAINNKDENTVYFNSLDGFYIIQNDIESAGPYWYGNRGDIQTYAKDINKYFYDEALSKAAGNETGPMGVIIMDYIGHDLEGGISGELLPQTIWDNNYHSTLPKKTQNDDDDDDDDDWVEEDDEDDWVVEEE